MRARVLARGERTCHWRVLFATGTEVIVSGATARRAGAAAKAAGYRRGGRGAIVGVEHACPAGCTRPLRDRVLLFDGEEG